MENIKVDKKGFYNLIKCIYEKLYGPVTIECKKSDKKRYNKIDIDNDFYKCDMEECCLKDENDNKILLSRKPIKGEKLYGSFVVKKLENIDASYMSLDEISDLIEDNKEQYPLFSVMLAPLNPMTYCFFLLHKPSIFSTPSTERNPLPVQGTNLTS